MMIGIYNLEPKYPNTALMQISSYHKAQGDEVELYNHFEHDKYDKIYASSIFEWTDKKYVTKDMIKGGTGFNVLSRLPPEIEACDYDYSIFPHCNYSIVWFSRGCPRTCSRCVVPRKEGAIKPVDPKPLNPKGKFIIVNDNNFFANPEWRAAIKQLREWGQPCNIQQGIDYRNVFKEEVEAILSLNYKGQIYFAWDDPTDNPVPKIKQMIEWGIRPYRLACYVLIGEKTTEEDDLYRVETLRSLGVDPFAMIYNKKPDPNLKRFAKWVNRKQLFGSCKWDDYKIKEHEIDRHQKVLADV
jgi:hypothetical protein